MGFVYEDEELELEYMGKKYKFRAPSAIEQDKTLKKFQDAGNTEDKKASATELYFEYFKDLGIPEEVLSKMTFKGLSDLFSYTVGAKKN